MSSSVRLEGFDKAVEMLEHLPNKVQKQVLTRIMRDAAKPIVADARSIVRPKSKRVAKSIKAWEPKGKTDPVLFVGPKFSKSRDADPWFAHMIEDGAKGIGRFAVKKTKVRNHDNDGKEIFKFINARRRGIQRYRADQSAHPFMAPAVERNRENVRSLFVNDLDNLIQREIAKVQ